MATSSLKHLFKNSSAIVDINPRRLGVFAKLAAALLPAAAHVGA
jgi:hypothetical protein